MSPVTSLSLKVRSTRLWRAPYIIGFLLVLSLVSIVHAQTADEIAAQRKQALALADSGRLVDALPLLQHLDQIKPGDAVIKEHLGYALMALAATKSDPAEMAEIRRQARKALLEAQALGDNSRLLRAGLDGLPENGSMPAFSNRQDVQEAMKLGETAFAKGDFDGAAEGYREALMLDPQEYEAALFLGDTYFRKKEPVEASAWFERAVSINPNRETAYRFWGDALLQSGKNSEALERYVDAIVAEPYVRQSSTGLLQLAQRLQVPLTQPHIVSPNAIKTDGARTNITINPASLNADDGTSAWLMYDLTRAYWHGDKFQKEFPAEKEYRHTLNEETDALTGVADSVEQAQKDGKVKQLDPQLAILLKLKQAGLIEAYVLISTADAGISKDYDAYRAAHRDLIHRYIAEYIAAPLRDKL